MPNLGQLPPQNRGLTAIAGAMALIAVLLIVQTWLLSAALESFLAGNRHTAFPAAIFSGVLFLVCLGLYVFVDGVDAGIRLIRAVDNSRNSAVDTSASKSINNP